MSPARDTVSVYLSQIHYVPSKGYSISILIPDPLCPQQGIQYQDTYPRSIMSPARDTVSGILSPRSIMSPSKGYSISILIPDPLCPQQGTQYQDTYPRSIMSPARDTVSVYLSLIHYVPQQGIPYQDKSQIH